MPPGFSGIQPLTPLASQVSTELRWVLQAVHHRRIDAGPQAKSRRNKRRKAQPMGMVESHGIDVFFVSPVSLCQFLEDF